MTGSHERCRGPWTTTCQPLVDFVAKHPRTFEPLHDHGHVLAGVVIVVEALSGFVRVEDRDANHCCLPSHCTIKNAAWPGQPFSRLTMMLALVDEIVGGPRTQRCRAL